MYTYRTKGVCSRAINVNLKAISKLVEGKDIAEVCSILDGNTCGNRSTSCADQLCHALREAKSAE